MAKEPGEGWEYNFEAGGRKVENPFDSSRLKEEYKLLLSNFKTVQRRLDKLVKAAIENGTGSRKYWEDRLVQATVILDDLVHIWKDGFPSLAEQGFVQGTTLADFVLNSDRVYSRLKRDPRFSGKLKRIQGPFVDENVVNAIYEDSLSYLEAAASGGKKKIESVFKATQQKVLAETKINKKLAEGILTDNNWKTAKENLEKTFRRKLKRNGIEDGNYLEINGRNYNVSSYSEMLTRTRLREAQTAGVRKYAEHTGNDLVQVSDHDTQTEICKKYEGKIFSISGDSKKYPKLEEWTPFHRNCLHVTLIFFDVVELLGYDPYEDAA
ncbi:phage minor capsid protein (plasmid) [Leptospira interrogans]|uniref:phage minor capsid protein n=1 Tax=Leptospira interrogans TaxID=173 RepID=UPI0002BF464F|nr:phage minor capsid protein [Leptospira interrogans]EMN60302.1 phage minor capsid protein 2 domain protein [Leptospira interrogans serovar Pyrogenes str. R168]ULG90655.1 phage minor capsid protein [Leptospira interrogans]UML78417.1 phage minor capsid protein [Leptospira interrogans]